jgi:hypothetical protein
MIIYDRIKELPLLVRVLSFTYNGYIVGGAAKYLTGQTNDKPRDWDVVVPPEIWSEVCKIVPHQTMTNTWGGFKIDNVDFWSEDLGHYFRTMHQEFMPGRAVHIRSKTVVIHE